MSTIDIALQRVAKLDEQLACELLLWLDTRSRPQPAAQKEQPLGAKAMIGFALQCGRAPRSTADWMKELREGDTD